MFTCIKNVKQCFLSKALTLNYFKMAVLDQLTSQQAIDLENK